MKKAFDKILVRLEREIAGKPTPDEYNNGINRAYQIVQEVAEEFATDTNVGTNGWIACSERLPDNDKKQYIVQKTNGFIDILDFTKDAYKLDKYDFAEYKDKNKQLFYKYDSEYGYIEWKCEAWMPLPEPYKAESEE